MISRNGDVAEDTVRKFVIIIIYCKINIKNLINPQQRIFYKFNYFYTFLRFLMVIENF